MITEYRDGSLKNLDQGILSDLEDFSALALLIEIEISSASSLEIKGFVWGELES